MTRDVTDDAVSLEVALPEELLEDLDQYAYRHGQTRSAVVAQALEG